MIVETPVKQKRSWSLKSLGCAFQMSGFSFLLGCVFLAICHLAFPAAVFAANVRTSWSSNTESDLAGYKLYYGVGSRNYGSSLNVGNVTSYVVTGLSAGTYYFAVTAYDSSGNESGLSNESSVTLTAAADTTAPVISSVGASSITFDQALISWTTDEASDSQMTQD